MLYNNTRGKTYRQGNLLRSRKKNNIFIFFQCVSQSQEIQYNFSDNSRIIRQHSTHKFKFIFQIGDNKNNIHLTFMIKL